MKETINIEAGVTPVFSANQRCYASKKNWRIIANQGSTRSSKTYSIMQLLIVLALTEKKEISVAGQSVPHLKRGAIKDFMSIMNEWKLYNPDNHNLTDKKYTFPKTGSYIEFLSCDDPGSVRGPGRDILFVNEANLVKKESFDQLAMRTKEKIFVDYNPATVRSYVYDLLLLPDTILIKSTYKHNLPNLTKAQIAQIESYNPEVNPETGDWNFWRVYGLGERSAAEAQVYNHHKLIGTEQWPVSPDETVIGIDFGFNNPTAVVEVAVKDKVYFIRELLYRQRMTNADLIFWMEEYLPRRATIYADAAEPARIQEISRKKFNIKPAKKEVNKGIDFVKSIPLNVTKESTNLLRELDMYCWKVDKDGHVLDEPVKAEDHLTDALRYACYTHFGRPQRKPFL